MDIHSRKYCRRRPTKTGVWLLLVGVSHWVHLSNSCWLLRVTRNAISFSPQSPYMKLLFALFSTLSNYFFTMISW